MSTLLTLTLLAGYASLAIELTLLHVPSVASSWNIWSRPPSVVARYSPGYRALFEMARPGKFALFVVPLLVTYGVYLYPLISVFGPHDPLGDHAFSTSAVSEVLAAALVCGGRVATLGSVLALRRGHAREPLALHTGGPFRHSRNPGLVGMYLFVTGLWIAAPSLTMLVGMSAYVAYMDFKVRMEEDYLRNKFGEAYHAYHERTNRYWP